VLCGGRSARMGKSKAWLPFGDETLLGRTVRIVGEVVQPVVVVAAPDQSLPALPASVQIARDPVEGRGPLQGLAAGLGALTGRAEAAYVSSCDVPFLKAAFVRRMISLLGDASVCVMRADGFLHPLAAVYRVGVLPVVTRLVEAGRLRTIDLLEQVQTRVVGEEEMADVDEGLHSLRNVNTTEEYERALRDYEAGGGKG
jgi:molybdenum cofactor guanylyltransferase